MAVWEWVLAIPFLVFGFAAHGVTWAVGWPIVFGIWSIDHRPSWCVRRVGMALVAAHAVGFGILGLWASVLGVFGILRLIPFVGGTAIFLVLGWHSRRVRGTFRQLWSRRGVLRRAPWVPIIPVFLMAANVVVGGLHHDMHQDPLWYHLSLPGQWALTSRLDVFPWQMNSVMPLSCEALSTVWYMIGGGVAITIFYAVATAWLLMGILILGWDLGRRPGIWTAAAFALLYGSLSAIAPIPSKNDNLAAILMLGSAVLQWELHLRLYGRGNPKIPSALFVLSIAGTIGLLVGGSISAKLTSALLIAAVVLMALGLLVVVRPRLCFPATVIGMTGMFLAWLPFIIRNGSLGISPLHPIGSSLFPGNSLLEPALTISATHQVYPLNSSGLMAMIGDFPGKAFLTLAARDVVLPVLLIALLLGPIQWRQPPVLSGWVCIVGSLVAFAWMKGHNNIGRYLLTNYPLALPVIVWMGREFFRRSRPQLAGLIGMLFLCIGTHAYWSKQWEWANVHTIQWRFRPELSDAEAGRVAAFREKGFAYDIFRDVKHWIPEDGIVLLADSVYPFYLERRAIWADEASGPLIPDWLGKRSSTEWGSVVRSQGITHVVVTWPGSMQENFVRFKRAVGLEEIASNRLTPTGRTWILYRVSKTFAPRINL